MVKVSLLEYNEKSGIGDLLFVNMNHPTQYRFYRRRKNWDECYMVEFCSDSDDYNFYWGHNEQDRGMIDAITLLLPPYPKVEWKRVKIPFLAYNLPQIVEFAEKAIIELKQ